MPRKAGGGRRPNGAGTINRFGYKLIGVGNGVQRLEHRVVAEKALGRPLPKGAIVHHVNGDRLDNRPENLVICPSWSYHRLIHIREDALNATGDPDKRICQFCHQWDDQKNLKRNKKAQSHHHRECKQLYRKEHEYGTAGARAARKAER